ncbi:heparinase II/III domain-containing protein [Plantactinospora sp. CA-290183]|uniref:heparinase II/III domain-containing protein n=1 Tax=Plantactinospora sp. CA-290183 TaxID=3240006 RepID=UPI003D8BC2AE
MIRLPTEPGGWWHAYVCPAHGVELGHVGLLDGAFPTGGAPCPHGCAVDTPAVRAAWTVLAHQECAREILSAARSPAVADRTVAVRLLREYEARYLALGTEPPDGAADWMLRGRLFHQALTEAIWAVSIGRAARCADDAVPALREALVEASAQARDRLVAEGRFTSNYTAWLCAAGAVCSGRPEWLDGPHGIYAHVLAATHDDGWEWEASTYYHAFVLRAYLLAVRAVPGAAPPAPVRARLAAMARVLTDLRTAGGLLPALHDGPYSRRGYDRELTELSELCDLTPRSESSGVTVHDGGGYAVVRGGGVHAVLDFGGHGGSHGHRDKLALYLYGADTPWQPDPGQVPYGHGEWRRYYASTAAHPTFAVDGEEQAECTGRLVAVDDTAVTVSCDRAYDGVSADRRVAVTAAGGVVDELTVTADRPRRITAHLRPDVPLTVRVTPVGDAETAWSGLQALRGTHTASVPARFVTRPGPGPADDPQRTRTHVDWTADATTRVTFRSVYRMEE